MYFKGCKNIDELLKKSNSPKIFCDLDGVLVDYDKGFKELEHLSPEKFIEKYGKNAFWKALSKHPRFFRDLEWMPDGKELWNYIKQYNPIILTAPVRKSTMPKCEEDKIFWVRKHLGTDVEVIVDGNKSKYASGGDILIDDRQKNIIQWKTADGVGILHTSAVATIQKLQQLLQERKIMLRL